MRTRVFMFAVAVVGGLIGSAYAGPIASVGSPAGLFGLPYNPNQTWPACGSSGWVPYGDPNAHQYHMQYYPAVAKYHMGEDWNGQRGICDGNSDEGAPLLAIGDGKVVFLDNNVVSGKGRRLYIRHSFPYALAPGGVATFDSAYLHLQGMASGITWSGPGTGSMVTKGQTIAYLGKTGTEWAHLHWETQWDDSLSTEENPYKNPLTVSHALKYRAPSLIVDDRSDEITFGGTVGQWTVFQMTGYAPSSIAYVEYNGERKSLQNAISAGWMTSSGIPAWDGSSWTWPSINTVFFSHTQWYAWMPTVNGATLHILRPKNNFKADRARLDIVRAASAESRFQNIRTEWYTEDLDWDANWELRQMLFDGANASLLYGGVYQITSKMNPLLRYTAYYDPQTGVWSGWQQVDLNQLY